MKYEDIIDHRSYTHNLSSCEIKAWKKFRPNGIRTHDLYDTGAVLYQLGYQANWERGVPVDGEEHKWIYEIPYIWTAEKEIPFRPEFSSGLNFTTA